jgi:hypothetical protein
MFWFPDELSLVITVHCFSKRIVKGITDASNGRDGTDLGEAFAMTN